MNRGKTFSSKVAKSMPLNATKTDVKKTKAIEAPPPFIKVERPVQHIGKGGSFYRARFKDLDGNAKTIDIPRDCSSLDAVKLLLHEHAKLPTARADQKLCWEDAVDEMGNKPTLKITDRLGWHHGLGDGPSFVYHGITFGPSRNTVVLDDDSTRNQALGMTAGSLEAWREGLREPALHSEHIILAISIGATGPLYDIVGNTEPAIYHFQGARVPTGAEANLRWKSSSGKTLSARCSQSLFGECSRTALFGFNMTALAMEETCFSCNNLVVVLDEQGSAGEGGGAHKIDPKVLPYLIIGGQGRRRSKHYALSQGLSNRSWVVPVITTSEDELDPNRSDRKEGAQVRMVPIPFPPTWQGGMFCSVESPDDRNRLALQVEATIAANYGVAMPAFVKNLVKDRARLAAEIVKMRDEFVESVGAMTNSWERRYAEKFGMPVAAAKLLVRYGIAPWTAQCAVTSITNLYRASRSLTVSVPQATDALIERLRKLVAEKTNFPKLPKGQTLTSDQKKAAWGVVRAIGAEKSVTLIPLAKLKQLVEPAAASDQVLHELKARNRLVTDRDGINTSQHLIMGLTEKRARYVCLTGLVAVSAARKSKHKHGKKSKGV